MIDRLQRKAIIVAKRNRQMLPRTGSWTAEHRFVLSLARLNKPLTIWEAVLESNPLADRMQVKRLVDQCNMALGYVGLYVDGDRLHVKELLT